MLPNQKLDGFVLKPNIRIVALETDGTLAYGTMPLPPDAWRPISGAYLPGGIHTPPTFTDPARVHNLTELCALRILPRQMPPEGAPFFPVALRGWQPRIDETILALGFPELDRDHKKKGDDRPIEQRLYGSFGKIIEIQKPNAESSRPWPIIRVDVEWSGGMSGGPVINAAGNVIGLVSTGIEGEKIGTANVFSGWSIAPHVFGTLDPNNPGWFGCYGVFDKGGVLRGLGQDQSELKHFAEMAGLTDYRKITINWQTRDYVHL